MPKVLIIEDEKDLFEMYKIQFQAASIDTAGANNTDDGFKLAKQEKPDIILLDLLLNQEDATNDNKDRGGYILLKKLKADPETKDINVIVFSNLDTQKDKAKAKKMGACEFFVKSEMVPKELVKEVQKWFK